jgi:transcriptional regulator with XRE-family HTH domain
MSRDELARAIGVSPQALVGYESGKRRVTIPIAVRLAELFDISLDELLGTDQLGAFIKEPLSPRVRRGAQQLANIPKAQQRFVLTIIGRFEEKNNRRERKRSRDAAARSLKKRD